MFPSRIAREPVGVDLSKSLKRRAPFANIAQASAFMSGSSEFVALSRSLPASCCPNLHHITPQSKTDLPSISVSYYAALRHEHRPAPLLLFFAISVLS